MPCSGRDAHLGNIAWITTAFGASRASGATTTKPALDRAELPAIRVHDLRHTAVSLWLAAGFPPYQVSRWLGHASVVTTDTTYSHLYPTNYAQHADRFERFTAEV